MLGNNKARSGTMEYFYAKKLLMLLLVSLLAYKTTSAAGNDEKGKNSAKSGPKPTPPPTTTPTPNKVAGLRLVGGRTKMEGVVEVQNTTGSWGVICDKNWGIPQAQVVCQHILKSAQIDVDVDATVKTYPFFGDVGRKSPTLLSSVDCIGSEDNLNICSELKFHKDGNICTGTTSEQHPAGVKCTHHNASYEETYPFGYPAESRRYNHPSHIITNSILILHPHDKLPSHGKVTSWTFMSTEANLKISLQIWRQKNPSENTYILVGRNNFTTTKGKNTFTVLSKDQICTEKEDVFGIYTYGSVPIPFDKNTCSGNGTVYLEKAAEIEGGVQLNSMHSFRTIKPGWSPCRVYSIYAMVKKEDACPKNVTEPPTTPPPEPTQIEVKLFGGRSNSEGLVMVRRNDGYNGTWGTVCDDHWDDQDALVVCKQLGFTGGTAKYPPYFGQGTGHIFMDNIQCDGKEKTLLNCSHVGWNNHNCQHAEDAGVECTGPRQNSSVFGYPPVNRNNKDTWTNAVFLPNPAQQIPVAGTIISWHYYIKEGPFPVSFYLQVWRPQNKASDYMLVGETHITVHQAGEKFKHLDKPTDKINFEAGDIYGIRFSGRNPIPFDHRQQQCAFDQRVNYMQGPPSMVVNHVYTFQAKHEAWGPCRMYSLYAEFMITRTVIVKHLEFQYAASSYKIVVNYEKTRYEADNQCKILMKNNTAGLAHLNTTSEYNALVAALSALDEAQNKEFWIAGRSHDRLSFVHWAFCQPTFGLECIVLSRFVDLSSSATSPSFYMSSRGCYDKKYYVCELDRAPGSALKPHKHSSIGNNHGVIAGVVIATLFLIVILAIVTVVLYRRWRLRHGMSGESSESTVRFVSLYDKQQSQNDYHIRC